MMLLLCFSIGESLITDMSTGGQFVSNWLEVGESNITDQYWTTVTGTYSSFVDPVVFTSLPEHGGVTYDLGVPTSTRIKNIQVTSGRVSWQMKVRRRLIYFLTALHSFPLIALSTK